MGNAVPEKESLVRRSRKSPIMRGACLAACLDGACLFGSAHRRGFLYHHMGDDHSERADNQGVSRSTVGTAKRSGKEAKEILWSHGILLRVSR